MSEIKYVEKKIDLYKMMIEERLRAIHSYYCISENFSHEVVKLFDTLMKKISGEVGHLSCDEYTDEYIIEVGYNIVSDESNVK